MDQVTTQVTKLIENIQLPSQFQRREAVVTIAAATTMIAVAGTMYSLIEKVYKVTIKSLVVRHAKYIAWNILGTWEPWLQNRPLQLTIFWLNSGVSQGSQRIHRKMDKGTRSSVPRTYFWRGKFCIFYIFPKDILSICTLLSGFLLLKVMTVVSGPYVREVFLNTDFNFLHGTAKERFVYWSVIQLIAAVDYRQNSNSSTYIN